MALRKQPLIEHPSLLISPPDLLCHQWMVEEQQGEFGRDKLHFPPSVGGPAPRQSELSGSGPTFGAAKRRPSIRRGRHGLLHI